MASRKEEYQYKAKQLEAMLNYEQSVPENEQFGASVHHWAGTSKPINIDAEAIKILVDHYKHKAYVEELMEDPKYRLHRERREYLHSIGASL